MPVTEALLKQWHRELNEQCFDSTLPDATFYFGLCRDTEVKLDYEALYYGDSIGRGTIFINPAYNGTEAKAKACLAHEMIHQWQDLCGLRLDHRAVFNAWCSHITSITGLVP